jgi:hypothetical protein
MELGHACEKIFCVGTCWIVENFLGGSLFNYFTLLHDEDTVRDVLSLSYIVCYE